MPLGQNLVTAALILNLGACTHKSDLSSQGQELIDDIQSVTGEILVPSGTKVKEHRIYQVAHSVLMQVHDRLICKRIEGKLEYFDGGAQVKTDLGDYYIRMLPNTTQPLSNSYEVIDDSMMIQINKSPDCGTPRFSEEGTWI